MAGLSFSSLRTPALLLLGIILLVLPLSRPLTLQEAASAEALRSIDETLLRNLAVFGTVSGIKAALAVVEGSSAGASLGATLQVEVGDVVQPAYDYIDFVWQLLLIALFVITFYKLVFESQILSIGLLMVGLGLLLMAVAQLAAHEVPRALGRKAIKLGLVVAYGLPLAILAADLLGSQFIDPLEERARVEVESLSASLHSSLESFGALTQKLSAFRPSESITIVTASAKKLGSEITAIAERSLKASFYFLAVQLFSLLLLPTLLLATVYSVLPRALSVALRR